jgi:dihydrofolate reductase
MRQIVLYITTSLDGYIASKDGSIDWLFTDQDYGYGDFICSVDTVLMGRKSYEQILGFDGVFPYLGKQVKVFSRHPLPRPETVVGAEVDIEFVNQDIVELVQSLKQLEIQSTATSGAVGTGNIWLLGGSNMLRQFVEQDLIDEYRIFIHPLILGEGIPLFETGHYQKQLQLIDSQSYSSGMVELRYRAAR